MASWGENNVGGRRRLGAEEEGFAEKNGLAHLKAIAESADDFTKQGLAG
jgi:hypothetical protein